VPLGSRVHRKEARKCPQLIDNCEECLKIESDCAFQRVPIIKDSIDAIVMIT
jgi:hypothetical protein